MFFRHQKHHWHQKHHSAIVFQTHVSVTRSWLCHSLLGKLTLACSSEGRPKRNKKQDNLYPLPWIWWAVKALEPSLSLFLKTFPIFCLYFVSCYQTLLRYWANNAKPWKSYLQNRQKISTPRMELICKRNTSATNATTQPPGPTTWKATSWFIAVRSRSRAHSANILAQQLATWKDTSSSTQGRILSNADNVTIPAKKLATSRATYWHIRVRKLTSAHNVTILVP